MPAPHDADGPFPDACRDPWSLGLRAAVVLGGGVGIAVLLSGPVALAAGAASISLLLGEEILKLAGARARRLRGMLTVRLASAARDRTDETVEGQTHTPFARARLATEQIDNRFRADAGALDDLAAALASVEARLEETAPRRRLRPAAGSGFAAGLADIAGPDLRDPGLRRYGDPSGLPRWLGPAPRSALARAGRVLDDVRLLHTARLEWVALVFMLWTRALMMSLAPALAALTFAPVPLSAASGVADVLWVAAAAWAAATAIAAPRVASGVLAPGRSRLRLALVAVELPLACAVTIAVPAWFVAAFAAGWINWWQRASRPRPAGSAIPPFSWIKAGAFVVVVAAAQSIGFALAGNAAGWPVLLEVAAALIAIAVIGSSYGAAWPISIGFGLRVVVAGVRARLGADRSARRVLDAAASSMSRTAQQIAEANPRDPSAAHTASTLWQAAADLQAHRSSEAGVSPQALGILVAQALRDAGPMVDTPLADQAAAAAARAGSPAPVLVEEARFGSPELSGVQMRRGDAATLRRLLTSCVVEARRHGTGRLDVRVDRDGPRVIVRMANRISPATKPGRSRGGREIAALADRLPDGRLEMRGVTGREFLGLPGQGELYGVRFSFSAPSPRTSARAPASWQC